MSRRLMHARLSKNIAAVTLSVIAAMGLSTQAASAATAPAPSVRTCFHYANGVAATGFRVKLYEASPTATAWTYAWYGTNGSNGCVTFPGVHRGYYYYASASKTYGNGNIGWMFLQGQTSTGRTGSTGTLPLSGVVHETCIAGLYGSLC